MERTLGGGRGGGMGMGGMIAGTLLASVAGAFIGTAIFSGTVKRDAMKRVGIETNCRSVVTLR